MATTTTTNESMIDEQETFEPVNAPLMDFNLYVNEDRSVILAYDIKNEAHRYIQRGSFSYFEPLLNARESDVPTLDLMLKTYFFDHLSEDSNDLVSPTNSPQSNPQIPESFDTLQDDTRSSLVGQNHLRKTLVQKITVNKITLPGVNDGTRVFMLNGPPGSGKTQMARCIAEAVHGKSEEVLQREGKYKTFNMGQFRGEEHANAFFGAAAGYQGGKGALVEVLQKCPTAVILLDECEKAHPSLRNDSILSIFNGKIISNAENCVEVNTKKATFIFTSNIAIANEAEIANGIVKIRQQSFEKFFDPPMISRLNGKVFQFKEPTDADRYQLMKMQLSRTREGLKCHKYQLTWDKCVIRWFVDRTDSGGSFRELVQNFNDFMNGSILSLDQMNGISARVHVHLSVDDGNLQVKLRKQLEHEYTASSSKGWWRRLIDFLQGFIEFLLILIHMGIWGSSDYAASNDANFEPDLTLPSTPPEIIEFTPSQISESNPDVTQTLVPTMQSSAPTTSSLPTPNNRVDPMVPVAVAPKNGFDSRPEVAVAVAVAPKNRVDPIFLVVLVVVTFLVFCLFS